MMKLKSKHFIRVAAAFAVVLGLPAIAYAAGIFSMEEMSIGPKKIEVYTQPEEIEGAHDAEAKMEEVEVDMISLQGTSESPEYKACRDWLDFTDSYDSDGAILSQVGNDLVGFGEIYEEIYGCYTQEMVDKLDEICEKYHLEKLEGMEIENDYKTICDNVGIGDIGGKTVENSVPVLLANSDHKALIIVDREKSYIVINVLGDSRKDSFGVSDKNLETLAEMFDFTVIP